MVNGNGVGYKQASEAILLVGYMTNCEFICSRMSPTASITSQVLMYVHTVIYKIFYFISPVDSDFVVFR